MPPTSTSATALLGASPTKDWHWELLALWRPLRQHERTTLGLRKGRGAADAVLVIPSLALCTPSWLPLNCFNWGHIRGLRPCDTTASSSTPVCVCSDSDQTSAVGQSGAFLARSSRHSSQRSIWGCHILGQKSALKTWICIVEEQVLLPSMNKQIGRAHV